MKDLTHADIIDFFELRNKYIDDIERVGCTRYESHGEINSRVALAFILCAESGVDIKRIVKMHDRKGQLEVTFVNHYGVGQEDVDIIDASWQQCGEVDGQVIIYHT
jgi:hypothetical protein